MIRKQIYIDNEQDKQIKEVAKFLGVAEAEIIRRAITHYMNVVCGTSVQVVERNKSDKDLAKTMNEMIKYSFKQFQEKLKKGE